MKNYDGVPLTAVEALKKWDDGDPVSTVEMGGIGPGYEQCIQVMAFELIRAFKDRGPMPEEEEKRQALSSAMDDELCRIDKEHGIGASGAQAGAAKWLAFMTLKNGWREIVKRHPEDRHILVSKHWPKA